MLCYLYPCTCRTFVFAEENSKLQISHWKPKQTGWMLFAKQPNLASPKLRFIVMLIVALKASSQQLQAEMMSGLKYFFRPNKSSSSHLTWSIWPHFAPSPRSNVNTELHRILIENKIIIITKISWTPALIRHLLYSPVIRLVSGGVSPQKSSTCQDSSCYRHTFFLCCQMTARV